MVIVMPFCRPCLCDFLRASDSCRRPARSSVSRVSIAAQSTRLGRKGQPRLMSSRHTARVVGESRHERIRRTARPHPHRLRPAEPPRPHESGRRREGAAQVSALAEALVAAQAELPCALGKDADGQIGQRSYRYLTLDKLIAETRPILTKHGLTIMQWPTFMP